jgi:hypothetical protein
MVNIMRELEREAERVLREILEGLPDARVRSKWHTAAADTGCDVTVDAAVDRARFRFCVQAKSRVTPQTALSACERVRAAGRGAIPVIFAPTISPRVAEVLRARRVSYADGAGNCLLLCPKDHLLIERQGFHRERRPTPAAVDLFSPKSSRIVRALLSEPLAGWAVRKLAEHSDVQVSPALVVKVKRALVEEGYAVERQRLLFLRDPLALLDAWSEKYRGPAEQVALYFRGDGAHAEQVIARWCADQGLQYALAGFSAAWRLAPEVRYNVAAVYVEDRGFDHAALDALAAHHGGKRVDSGPTLQLWRPFDRSVFTGRVHAGQPEQPVTSALQTYLDLRRAAGRGEDAAKAVFEKYLEANLEAAARREQEPKRGTA